MIDSNPVTPDPDLLGKYFFTGNQENSWKSDDSTSRNEAEVYIPTLSRFKGPAKGHFSLTGLKMISATKTFLERIGSSGGCSLQSFDKCHEEIFLERLSEECGCTPFSLSFVQPHQVGRGFSFIFDHLKKKRGSTSVHLRLLRATSNYKEKNSGKINSQIATTSSIQTFARKFA